MFRRIFLTAAVGAAAAALALAAHAAPPHAYHAPRTIYGQPDLQGFWTNGSLTRLERTPGEPLGFANPAEERAYEKRRTAAWNEGARPAGWGRASPNGTTTSASPASPGGCAPPSSSGPRTGGCRGGRRARRGMTPPPRSRAARPPTGRSRAACSTAAWWAAAAAWAHRS